MLIELFWKWLGGVFIIPLAMNAQETNQSKGELALTLGAQYRITPIYFNGNDSRPRSLLIGFQQDAHLSGSGLSYEFRYQTPSKKFEFGLRHSIRYDHALYIVPLPDSTQPITIGQPINDFFHDYQGFIAYRILGENNQALGLELAFGLMNDGPIIGSSEYQSLPGIEVVFTNGSSYKYYATTLGLSYEYKNAKIVLRNHLTAQMPLLFAYADALWIVEFGVNYKIINLFK